MGSDIKLSREEMVFMRKLALLLPIVVATSLLFTGCQRALNNVFFSNADAILINSQQSDEFSVRLALVTKSRVRDVVFVGLEGTGVENAGYQVTITDSNADALNAFTHKGCYLKYLTLNIETPENERSCTISAVILDVDGESQKIVFATPLRHTFIGGFVGTQALGFSAPGEVSSKMINSKEQGMVYVLYANEDLMLDKVYFLDFLEVGEMKMLIDDEPVADSTHLYA